MSIHSLLEVKECPKTTGLGRSWCRVRFLLLTPPPGPSTARQLGRGRRGRRVHRHGRLRGRGGVEGRGSGGAVSGSGGGGEEGSSRKWEEFQWFVVQSTQQLYTPILRTGDIFQGWRRVGEHVLKVPPPDLGERLLEAPKHRVLEGAISQRNRRTVQRLHFCVVATW